MKIILTGAGGSLGAEISRELESMQHKVYGLNRSNLDFNISSSFDLTKCCFDGLIICHGEYFDKLLDPQIALENFKNTRGFIINMMNNNSIKFVSFIERLSSEK